MTVDLQQSRWLTLLAAAIASLSLLAVDVQFPRGISVGAAYVVVLFLVAATREPWDLMIAGAALSALIWIGVTLSPASEANPVSVFSNRTLSVLTVCIIAWLLIRSQKLVAQLEAHQSRLEEALRDSTELEERFRQIIEAAPNGMVMVDSDGRITLMNAEAERQFQYSRETAVGQPVEILLPERLRTGHPDRRRQFFAHPSVRSMGQGRELFGLRRDGTEFPVEIGLNPVRVHNELFVLSSIVDITERRDAQQRIELMNAELLARNEEMQQFVYTVSHDLKSPLVTLEGFAGLLREELDDGNLAEARHCAERIERSTERMGRLISDLLELSRAGSVPNAPERIDISHLVEEVCFDLRERLDEVGMTVDIQPDMPELNADRVRLGQVFENLISNAVKYGSTGDRPRLAISGHVTDGEIIYKVSDNGRGIPREFHETILRPFERLDSSVEGTGIGLAIVARVVSLNGGHVQVESEPGHGTTIRLSFPKTPNAPDPA